MAQQWIDTATIGTTPPTAAATCLPALAATANLMGVFFKYEV